jgi:ankyrin repeat protein
MKTLNDSADHKNEDEDYESPLIEITTQDLENAIKKGQMDLIESWIKTGEVAMDTRISGRSLLSLAVHYGNLPLLTFLWQRGAGIGSQSLQGHSLFYWALQSGHPDIIAFAAQTQFLIRYQEDDKAFTHAHLLAARPDEKALAVYLASYPHEKDKPMKEGHTPLHIAILAEHPKNVAILCQKDMPVIGSGSISPSTPVARLWAKTKLSLSELKKPISFSSTLATTPASRNYYGLMRPKRETKWVNELALNRLLQFVAGGRQEQAEQLIKKNNGLLLVAGTLTDSSGRRFTSITAFQYALWALDWHMWKMIRKYLPPEAQAEQFAKLELDGTEHGQHFDLQPLIKVLQIYVKNAEKVWKYNQRAVDYWCNVVSSLQKLLPESVINEYCRQDRSFYPCPSFTEASLPRTRQFFDQGHWHSVELKGVVRGVRLDQPSSPRMKLLFALGSPTAVTIDIKALQSLSKTRTQQLERLRSQLKPFASDMTLSDNSYRLGMS